MCKINTNKLIEMRKNAGMTQEELANKVGISRSTINQYENGKVEPSEKNIINICNYFNITKDDLEMHDVGYDFLNRRSDFEDKLRKKEGFVRYSDPRETEKWIAEHRTLTEEQEIGEIKNALSSSFTFCGKEYIAIDPTLIHVPDWQRDTDMAKAMEIAENYDDKKFDPIKIYLTEEGKAIGADGIHRDVARIMLNAKAKDVYDRKKVIVEVLHCTEQEAVITFLTQQSGRKTMSVNDTYRAGIKANIAEYVIFKELFVRNNVQISAEYEKLEKPIGTVRPSTAILRMARSNYKILETIINLIKKLNWCGSDCKGVFTMRIIGTLNKILAMYGDDAIAILIKNCKGATYYDSEISPVGTNSLLFDKLAEIVSKEITPVEIHSGQPQQTSETLGTTIRKFA
jgi:DNA-binding XRE family transcriptional regulator